jgi:NADH-quinone oxidoreductase subunit J
MAAVVMVSPLLHLPFAVFAVGAVVTGYLVFRTDSMIRASFWLLASFVNVGVLLLLLNARFLGLSVLLMMAGEMSVMAVFMVMFMMNPAGLNPMMMVHQHRAAIAGGVIAFLALAGVGVFTDFPNRPARQASAQVTEELGVELLGDSMLVFQGAGVTLLATMIGTIAVAGRKGRYGLADEGSQPPPLEPGHPESVPQHGVPEEAEEDKHAGHGGHG